MLILWVIVLCLPWIALLLFPAKTVDDAARIKSILGQLGTYGDMFGALTSLFTGAAFIGAGYAVVLQLRQLRHQQEDMERNERHREAAYKAREKELRDAAAWEHRAAGLNAASSLTLAFAIKLASIPAEIISHADKERLEARRKQRAETEQRLEEFTIVLANLLEQFSKEQTQDLRAGRMGKAVDDLLKAAGGKPETS